MRAEWGPLAVANFLIRFRKASEGTDYRIQVMERHDGARAVLLTVEGYTAALTIEDLPGLVRVLVHIVRERPGEVGFVELAMHLSQIADEMDDTRKPTVH